ncbi:Adenosylcobalamin/alpha-ribazole phosphatase [Pseudocercospora fuligena]|uniref:Adenosylcobalamin/alpha-ribazole phosphatase n=1 Tax=Pseudocercospora fuligena TaxID=685502 RepID=A0A8H6RHF6_9PEZI|nr:Adenosylcobalamin/alpha-ribazole phosphatase [Pseudocercospora fuligena]
MDLFLIRHGETVDNVAGLYAGVRDSQLTNYGVDQTKSLGEHLAQRHRFTHIFASPLSRAYRTAQAIQAAQPTVPSKSEPVQIVQVQELIEQNFGFYEGRQFQARTDPKKTGREAHRLQHQNDPGFVDVESKDSMNRRADVFLDEHLMPLFSQCRGQDRFCVAVVSHGMLLSHLWRRLLLRLPSKSVTVDSAVTAARGPVVLQHLGGFSNTGYLELAIKRVAGPQQSSVDNSTALSKQSSAVASSADAGTFNDTAEEKLQDLPMPTSDRSASPGPKHPTSEAVVETANDPLCLPTGWITLILSIDRKDHLTGLKRQRGGIGRSAHDEKQGRLEAFFKKQRTS